MQLRHMSHTYLPFDAMCVGGAGQKRFVSLVIARGMKLAPSRRGEVLVWTTE